MLGRIEVTMKALLIFALAISLLLCSPVAAQTNCAERSEVITKLEQKFAEQPIGQGLLPSGILVEIITSQTGSWTLLLTYASGMTCVWMSGHDWQSIKPRNLDEVPI